MGKYIPLVVRQAMRATQALEQAKVDIAKLREVQRLQAKVLAMATPKADATVAPNYDGGGKPVKYSVWKRFVDSLVSGYVPNSVGTDSVQVYCVHCEMPTDATTVKRIGIGVVTEYDEMETKVVPHGFSWDWEDEEVTRIRPAIHKGDGCPACAHAYMKAVAQAARPSVRITYTVDGVKKSLYAADIRQGASKLAEQMGRVELLNCKAIPPRQGFLNVRLRVEKFTPDPKVIARDMERRALALASLQAIQERTDRITAKVLADNMASKHGNRRRNLKAILREGLKGQRPALTVRKGRTWLRVADIVQQFGQEA